MKELKKYLICNGEIDLNDLEQWGVVKAEDEEKSIDVFVRRKGIYNKKFLCDLDMILIDSFMISRGKITDEYKRELLDYFEGNEEYSKCILDIYGEEQRIYDDVTGQIDLRISEDMLVFIYKKENIESIVSIDIDINIL